MEVNTRIRVSRLGPLRSPSSRPAPVPAPSPHCSTISHQKFPPYSRVEAVGPPLRASALRAHPLEIGAAPSRRSRARARRSYARPSEVEVRLIAPLLDAAVEPRQQQPLARPERQAHAARAGDGRRVVGHAARRQPRRPAPAAQHRGRRARSPSVVRRRAGAVRRGPRARSGGGGVGGFDDRAAAACRRERADVDVGQHGRAVDARRAALTSERNEPITPRAAATRVAADPALLMSDLAKSRAFAPASITRSYVI